MRISDWSSDVCSSDLPALEPVGEFRHRRLQVDELLVEIGTQPLQFLGVTQLARSDHFIELRRPHLVIEAPREIGERPGGADGKHPLIAIVARFALGIVERLFVELSLTVLAVAFLLTSEACRAGKECVRTSRTRR